MESGTKISVTMADVESVIVEEKYLNPTADELLTICIMTLKNGARVSGTNFGAIDPRWHDPERGKSEARSKALDKVFELEGYLLRQRLMEAEEKKSSVKRFYPVWAPDLDKPEEVFVMTSDVLNSGSGGQVPCPLLAGKRIPLYDILGPDFKEKAQLSNVSIAAVYIDDGLFISKAIIRPEDVAFSGVSARDPSVFEMDLRITTNCQDSHANKTPASAELEFVGTVDVNKPTGFIFARFSPPTVLSAEPESDPKDSGNSVRDLFQGRRIVGYDIVVEF